MSLPTAMTITSAAFTFITGAALTLPLQAHQRGFLALTIRASLSDDDGGLLYSDNPVVLADPSTRSTNRGWIQFRTDPCGTLLRVDGRRSILTQCALNADDDADGSDEFDEDDAADTARDMIERWLSEHPEIAVINDGIDKGCDDARLDDENAPDDWGSAQIA